MKQRKDYMDSGATTLLASIMAGGMVYGARHLGKGMIADNPEIGYVPGINEYAFEVLVGVGTFVGTALGIVAVAAAVVLVVFGVGMLNVHVLSPAAKRVAGWTDHLRGDDR